MKIKKFEEGMIVKIINPKHSHKDSLLKVDMRAVSEDGTKLKLPIFTGMDVLAVEDVLAIDFDMLGVYFDLAKAVSHTAGDLYEKVTEQGKISEREVLGVVAGFMGLEGGAKYFLDELAILLGWEDVDAELEKFAKSISEDHVCEDCRERFCRGKKEM